MVLPAFQTTTAIATKAMRHVVDRFSAQGMAKCHTKLGYHLQIHFLFLQFSISFALL